MGQLNQPHGSLIYTYVLPLYSVCTEGLSIVISSAIEVDRRKFRYAYTVNGP